MSFPSFTFLWYGTNAILSSYGNIITSTSDFAAFWTTVASEFTDNDLVIFDTSTYPTLPPIFYILT